MLVLNFPAICQERGLWKNGFSVDIDATSVIKTWNRMFCPDVFHLALKVSVKQKKIDAPHQHKSIIQGIFLQLCLSYHDSYTYGV